MVDGGRDLVVAVDPGGTTGLATAWIDTTLKDVVARELSPYDAVAFIDELLTQRDVAYVACESFVPRPGIRSWQPDAIETIGALRYLCHRTNTPFELQSPADAKRFSTNAKLERLGWRHPTRGGHADDALRHLLLLATRHRLIDAGTLL